jgi:MFS transporter, SP family, general alpha glucoside:H+ symporter
VVWAAQILCGNAILGFSVVFLESAGFSATTSFDINISLSACYIIGGVICWILFPHFGRATIYMSGLSVMFILLVTIGGLGFSNGDSQKTAVAILFVISTLVNMISVGPVCYPIVAETPSGRLRYKTVVIGRFVYNLTGIFSNSVTPRMVSPIGSSAYFALHLNISLTIFFRMELGSQERSVLRRYQPPLQHLVLVPSSGDKGQVLRRD